VYVADTGNNRIQKFTGSGAFITKWGSAGTGNGQFDLPFGVCVSDSGDVYVADANNNRVQRFTPAGAYVTQWGSYGTGDAQFDALWGVSTDASGAVYAVDIGNKRVQKFTSTGGYLTQWGSNGSADGQFGLPYGVEVDASGDIYVSDVTNPRIQKFGACASTGVRPDGSLAGVQLAPAVPNPWAGATTLRFSLAAEGPVTLAVYDVAGRQVKRWSWGTAAAGAHQVAWDGRGDDGRPAPAGVLFYRLETESQPVQRTMVRIR
jgi:DNA-binding beta-propeller fold protein YncE